MSRYYNLESSLHTNLSSLGSPVEYYYYSMNNPSGLMMTSRGHDVLNAACISENFLEVNSAQNSKKSERIARASFVDYVSEVVTRPGLHSSNSTLTSVAREASVRSDLAPANGRPARPVSVTATGSKYKYSGEILKYCVHSLEILIKIGIYIYQKQCRKNLKRVKLTKTFVKCITRGTTSSLTHCPRNLVSLLHLMTICRGLVVQPLYINCSVYP